MNKGHAQSINVNPETFPNETSLNWNYPHPADFRIFSFPEIVFSQSLGKTGAYMPAGFGLVAPGLRKLIVSYDIAISGDSFTEKHSNIAFDLWLTPGTSCTFANRKFEIFLGVHLRASCEEKFSYFFNRTIFFGRRVPKLA